MNCSRDKVDCSKFCAGQCDPFGASCWYEENKPRPQPEEKPHRQPSMALVMAVVALFWVAVAVGVNLALKGAP
jgi:hypothetical protein